VALAPPRRPDACDAAPDLQHGIPGVQWKSDTEPDPGGTTRLGTISSRPPVEHPDAKESYALYLGLIFGIALVLRLLVVLMGPMFDPQLAYTPGTETQVQLADQLVAEQTFRSVEPTAETVTAPIEALRIERGERGQEAVAEVHESPGYPAVLAGFRAVGLPLTWLLLLQCVIGAACTLLVFKIGLGITGRKAPSALAAAIVALHPALLVAPSALAGEVIVSALVLAAVWAVADRERRDVRGVAGGGLAIGAAALFAPLYAWLAPVLATWMILTERRLHSVGLALVLLVGTALPVGGWVYRNQTEAGLLHVSAMPKVDRLFGTVAAAQDPVAGPYAPQTVEPLVERFERFTARPEHAGVDTFTLLDRFGRTELNANRPGHLDALAAGARRLALDHSTDDAYARLGIDYAPAGYAATLLGEPVASATPEEAVTEWVINVWVGLNALLVAGMAVGVVMMLWHRRFAGLLLLLAVAGLVVYFSTTGASESMRLPILGLQALLITAAVAPAPLRQPKPKKLKQKMSKLKKLEDDGPRNNSPLATADSLRPAPEQAGRARLTADDEAQLDEAASALEAAVHPALRKPAEPDDEPEAGSVFAGVAAGSGRPI
jgi:hypothetical protein